VEVEEELGEIICISPTNLKKCKDTLSTHIFLCVLKVIVCIALVTFMITLLAYKCNVCLTLRVERRQRVFENRVLRRVLGPKREEAAGKWRKLHSEEVHILLSSRNIIRQIKSKRMRWAGHVVRMGEERNVYRVLMGKPEGKRPLGRPRRRWEDGI
jgi:hypothetical protein